MSNYIVNDNGVDREATPEEIKQIKEANADAAALEAAAEAKAAAKAAVLAKLGLTADEAAALLG
jgi:hypothetical protein